jgi:hypothetical protein
MGFLMCCCDIEPPCDHRLTVRVVEFVPSGIGGTVTYPSGATVTVTADGFSATATTSTYGYATVLVPLAAETYHIVASHGGYEGFRDYTIADWTNCRYFSTEICIRRIQRFYIGGCNVNDWGLYPPETRQLPGVSLTLKREGEVAFTRTSDEDYYDWDEQPVNSNPPTTSPAWTVSASKSRFATITDEANTFNVQMLYGSPGECGLAAWRVFMTPDSSHHCSLFPCMDPLGESLTLTDSFLGLTVELTWTDDPPSYTGLTYTGWYGETTFDFPGCPDDPYGGAPTCPPVSGVRIFYFVYDNGSQGPPQPGAPWVVVVGWEVWSLVRPPCGVPPGYPGLDWGCPVNQAIIDWYDMNPACLDEHIATAYKVMKLWGGYPTNYPFTSDCPESFLFTFDVPSYEPLGYVSPYVAEGGCEGAGTTITITET